MPCLVPFLDQIGSPRLLVLGDVMLDRYTWGEVNRVSPEAPILVLSADQADVRLGGAASVAGLLCAFQAHVTLAGVLGDDANGRTVLRLLDEAGVEHGLLKLDVTRPTTTKERFLGRCAHREPHQVLRVDYESTAPLVGELEQSLIESLVTVLHQFDAVLISDYAKGVCTPALLRAVLDMARQRDIPVIVDPARIPDFLRYRGARIMKPNRVEAELATGTRVGTYQDAIEAGRLLREQLELTAVVVTLDSDGMVLASATELDSVFATRVRKVCDVTGAGDMALAMLGLGQAARLPLAETVQLANVAAGLQVERLGVIPISLTEIRAELNRAAGYGKLVSLEEMAALAAAIRRSGRKIVFTNGCFDLLNIGHVSYLQQAAALGDVLVVALNSDRSVRALKGSARPVIKEADRASMLSAFECVNHVLVFDEPTPLTLLRVELKGTGPFIRLDGVVSCTGDHGSEAWIASQVARPFAEPKRRYPTDDRVRPRHGSRSLPIRAAVR